MYEVFCTITDEYGTRTASTGSAAFLEAFAYEKLDILRRACTIKGATFHVEYVPRADEWNSY